MHAIEQMRPDRGSLGGGRRVPTFEEVRIGGELKFVKVTPRTGRPYYLIPDQGGRQFIRRDSLDPTLRVPMWVLFSW